LDYHSFDFDLAALSSAGKHWTETIPSALLRDATVGVLDAVDVACSDAHWSGSLLRTADGFHMQASFSLHIERRCDRCLSMFDWLLKEENKREFVLGTAVENHDEENIQIIDFLPHPGRLNLVDLLREEIWLAWRAVLVCDKACQGLAAASSLNKSTCTPFSQDEDHPFAALQKLKQ